MRKTAALVVAAVAATVALTGQAVASFTPSCTVIFQWGERQVRTVTVDGHPVTQYRTITYRTEKCRTRSVTSWR